MFEERTQQRLLTTASSQGLANSFGQMLHIIWYKVGHIRVFGSIPNLLVGIKFWGIRRQPFDRDSFFESPLQFFGSPAMNHPAIPDQNDTLGKTLKQCRDKWLSIFGSDIMAKQFKMKSHLAVYGRNTDCRHDREPISAIPAILDRGFASWRPRPPHNRLKHKAAFISKYDGFTAFSRVFLYAASRFFATLRSHLRCVRGLCVPASDNSSPSLIVYATHLMGRTLCQNAFLSPQPHERASRDHCNSHAFRGLEATDWQVVSTVLPSACKAVLYAASPSGHPGHTADRLFSIAKLRRMLRRNAWLPANPTILVPATPWLPADAAPFSCMKVYSSYKILSAKPYCFSKLFKAQ